MTKQVVPLLYKTYLTSIQQSVNTHQYRNFYALVDDQEQDILRDGELSCAYFVSCILHQFLLVDRPHTTVLGTKKALEESGWTEIGEPREGCVLLWEPQSFDGEEHAHIGFYVGNHYAISNSATLRTPQLHNWQFSETQQRKITNFYWNPLFKTTNIF